MADITNPTVLLVFGFLGGIYSIVIQVLFQTNKDNKLMIFKDIGTKIKDSIKTFLDIYVKNWKINGDFYNQYLRVRLAITLMIGAFFFIMVLSTYDSVSTLSAWTWFILWLMLFYIVSLPTLQVAMYIWENYLNKSKSE